MVTFSGTASFAEDDDDGDGAYHHFFGDQLDL